MFLSDGGLFSLIPTLLFILIILFSIIFGILRGFRKSVILGIQALVAFVACLIAYFVIVNNAQTDTNIVNIANAFLGDGGLQNTLGVSTNNSSLTDIIMELILNNTNMGNGMALVLKENGAYLMAITNLVYHIIFFVLLWIVYLLLVFIFYIIYLIFYPERRHSRKVNKKYQETDPDKKYKKHRIFGGAIGALRGIVAGFMIMSVIGSIFYVVGGTGEGEYKEYDWGDETYNTTYSIYSQTGSYGNSGVFKVLNTIKDQDNIPFYLFMANNFLSGNSYEGELKSNLVLSKDLGAVTVFARSSFDLILKYGKEDIITAIKESGNSEEGSNKLLQVIGNVYSNIEFQNEFNKLIDDFNTNTFFVDMTFSVLDSFVNHLNEMTLTESLPSDTVELLNVLFNKNYISPYIPDDQANFEANGEVATIKPNMLLQKEDVKVAFKITFNVLSNESTNDQVLDTVNLATTVMDDIDELSLLNSKNKDNFNPVFERLYTHLSNYYLSKDSKEEDNKQELLSTSYLLEDTNSESIDWVEEIKSLLKIVNSGLKLFSSVYESTDSSDNVTSQIVNSIYSIFDIDNEKYEYNHGLFNDVVDGLSSSVLLGKVLETNFITKSMVGFLEQMTQGIDLYIPDNLEYSNTSTEKGEIYNLFKGIEALFSNTNTKTVMTNLVNGNSLTNDDLYKLCNSFLDDNEKVLNYLLSSKLVSSTVSGLLLSINIEDIQIIYPNTCKEMVDNKYVNLIQKEEIKELIRMVPDLLKSLESSDQTKGIINFVVDNKENVSQSDILCATVANYLSNNLPSELSSIIEVPDELKNAATKEELTKFEANNPWRSEIKRLLDVFEVLELNDPNLDFSNSDNLTNQIIGNILDLNEPLSEELLKEYQNENYQTKLDLCYGSPIILATLTKQIDTNINEGFIDDLSKEKAKENGKYKKEELKTLINSLNELEITDFSNIKVDDIVNKVLSLNETAITNPAVSKLDVCYESTIIKSVIAKQLDTSLNKNDVHENVINYSKEEYYYKEIEIKKLIDGINAIGISTIDEINGIDFNSGSNVLTNLSDNVRLTTFYQSYILVDILTNELDNIVNTNDLLIYNSEAKELKSELGTLEFYKQLEVKTLIDFINEKLGGAEFSNVDSSSITIDSAFKNYTANSKILAATMTKQIHANDTIVIPSYTISDGEYNVGDYIIQNEMDNLIDGLNTLFGTGTINSINLNISLDSSKIDAIYNSNILNATISKQLASNSNIIIPSGVLKEKTTINEIKNDEVKAFLTSVTSGLGISERTINGINSNDIKLPTGDLDLFVESDIMRATVTKNVKATGDDPLPLFVSTEYCEKTYAVDKTDAVDKITNILVLSKAEVKALINAIKVLNASNNTSNESYVIDLSILSISKLKDLDEVSLNTLLESNIIRIYVTTILVNDPHITLVTTNVYAYELGSTLDETVKVEIADKTAIKSALAI